MARLAQDEDQEPEEAHEVAQQQQEDVEVPQEMPNALAEVSAPQGTRHLQVEEHRLASMDL